ncbi:MAG: hypothetical protein ABI445_22845 [Polyangia bacterium]
MTQGLTLAPAGHRTDVEWKAPMTLLAPAVAPERERGATSIDLGYMNDAHTLRLGAVATPRVLYSLSV